MKGIAILVILTAIGSTDGFGTPFGQIYGPHDFALSKTGLTVETSRYNGSVIFLVKFQPLESLKEDDWISELVVWENRKDSVIEFTSRNQHSTTTEIECRFSIKESRIADSDFRFQSIRAGNPGLFYELNLSAFADATEQKSTFPNKAE